MTGPIEPDGPPARPQPSVDVHPLSPSDGDGAIPYGMATDGRTPVRPGTSRPSNYRGHPGRIVAALAIMAGLVVLVGGYLWVQHEANPSGPPGLQILVTVPAGGGVNSTGTLLADRGVIGSSLAFRVWGQFNSLPGVQAGAYVFNRHSSFDAVQKVLAAGPNVFPLVVPPGFTVAELAHRVGQLPGHFTDSFLKSATNGTVRSPWQPSGVTSLEGLLAAGTYTVIPGETDRELLTKMVDRFDTLATKVGLASGAAQLGYTPYQVVIVASVVEKEGALVKNMGPVARVVYNRLAKHTALQMDSTVLYALGRDGGPVTQADLRTESPYNTYLNKGLPPTPTCFPSEEALTAALHPPEGPWLFFVVVQQDGTEAFSTTYAGQLANEALAKQHGLG